MKSINTVILILGVAVCTYAAPDCLDKLTAEECAEYMKTGGGKVVLPLTDMNQFTDEKQAMLKVVLANVSDQYVIVDVEPEHILITNIHLSPENDNKVTVDFFVANPTGSVVMPVAFRSQELYLVLKLNKETIDSMLDYEVIAVEPDSSTNLPLPTWALAIIVYVALIIILGLIYFATKDFRRQWSQNKERELRKAVLGDSDMEIDLEAGETDKSDEEPKDTSEKKMYRDTQVSFGVQVSQGDIAATLGITYATVENNGDVPAKAKCDDSPLPEKSEKPPDYHEATADGADDSGASTSSSDSENKSEKEATAALEGAVNEAFEEDTHDQSTSL
ncbi:uncharacterized protein LOC110977791 [Acanthaster planci]|uniref:Uncharacterized protein LOC110977791 n=1 Tax=Acanthaster planci TaxID=133434 RepID=A0A8B7Y5V2_ACAPL|nr:uncharacterized protein LOC110977791 [Acanthaster planci]